MPPVYRLPPPAPTPSMPVISTLADPGHRRWLALVVVCLAQLMNVLDTTIVNVALPDIQRELGFSQAGLTWVVNAFLVTFGGFLLLAGRLGALLARRRVFLAGGALSQALGWHWIFFVNLPIGAATLVLGRLLIPADEGLGLAHGVDW